jgi:hypothetical protein
VHPEPIADAGQYCYTDKGGAANEITVPRGRRRHRIVDGMAFLCLPSTRTGTLAVEIMHGFADVARGITCILRVLGYLIEESIERALARIVTLQSQ